MATKKFLELKEFSLEELNNELSETKKMYSKMKFDHAIKGLENPMALKEVRRDVARLNTEVRRRELAEIAPEGRDRIRSRRRRNK